MSEVSKTVARKPEAKRENSVSQSQKANPSHSANPSVDRILFLQRTAGNHAVQKLIKSGRLQTNLRISQPGDIHEQEAEKVAQQVVSSTQLEGSHATTSDNKKNKSIQLSTQHSSDTAGASVPENFIPQPGHGQPINPSTKQMLESHIDADLSNVRVHSDTASHEAAKNLNARAFTYKNDIYLGSGESQNNVQLMAHEATHVVQQGAVIQRSPDDEASTSSSKGFWERAKEAVLGAKEAVLEKVDKLVVNIPGFSLLCFILGRNPVTDKPVERNAINLFHGVLGLVPGGEALFENLQKSGAIEDAFAWLNAQIEKLNLTWEFIKGLFKQAWDALSITDVANPSKALEKIQNIFGPTLGRIKNFAVAVGQKIFDFIFEGVLKLAGPLGTKVLGIIRKAGDTVSKIFKDPIGFLGNLVQAIRKGFDQFSANILTHLKEGLMKWLFGALSGAGLRLPAKFDLMGILSIVLQVIGLTYAKLREKLVKILGEKPVAFIETAFEFLSLIVTKGLTAAWEKFLEFIGDLKEMVLGAIRDWVAGSIIKKAITKLVSMFNPVGAIIQAIMMTYDAITFFIERAKQVGELAEAVFDSVANIATGNLGAAANYVEKTMARTIPVIIGFLASLIGLGGISEKIKKIIEGIQAKIDNALDKIVNFIVTKVKALFGKGEKKESKESPEIAAIKAKAVNEVIERTRGKKFGSVEDLQPILIEVFNQYQKEGLKSISIKVTDEESMDLDVLASASEPDKRTIKWEELFEEGKPEDKEKFKTQPRNETNAAISVNKTLIGEVVKSEKDHHAEQNLINDYWDKAIKLARESAAEGKNATIAVAINRAPCHKICTPLLVKKINEARKDILIREKVSFILAPTGIYEPTNNLTEEELKKADEKYEKIGKKLGSQAYKVVSKAVITDDATEWADLEALVNAGWDLHQLKAKPKSTVAGDILGEAAHKLAVKTGKIKAP